MHKKRVKFTSGGGGGGDDGDEGGGGEEYGMHADEDDDDNEEDIQYQNVAALMEGDEEEEHNVALKKDTDDKTLLQLTQGINGETAKQRIESAVYQFAVGVMFVRKCLVTSCGVSDTYTFDTELKQFYASHPHLREQLGPGHVPPGSGDNDINNNNDNDDDDMYIPQRK